MKLPKTDAALLLFARPAPAQPALPQTTPAEEHVLASPVLPALPSSSSSAGEQVPEPTSQAVQEPRRVASEPIHPLFVLRKALPSLWLKVRKEKLVRREQRERLVQLMTWLCEKGALQSRTSVTQRYAYRGELVEGRLTFCANRPDCTRVVAVELAFEWDEAQAHKLTQFVAQAPLERRAILALAGRTDLAKFRSRLENSVGAQARLVQLLPLEVSEADKP